MVGVLKLVKQRPQWILPISSDKWLMSYVNIRITIVAMNPFFCVAISWEIIVV